MISLILSTPECLDEALASAATALAFGQHMQLLVTTELSNETTPAGAALLEALAAMNLPVRLAEQVCCPIWLMALSPRRMTTDELAQLLANSTHCLSY